MAEQAHRALEGPAPKFHEAEELHGVVALLDALGTKERPENVKATAESLDFLIGKMAGEVPLVFRRVALGIDTSEMGDIGADSFGTYWLGDSMVVTLSNNKPSPAADGFLVALMGAVLQVFVREALDAGFLFRGAISTGDFVTCGGSGVGIGTVTIGPAIAEASQWYELADWAGLNLTPSAGWAYSRFFEASHPISKTVSKAQENSADVYAKWGLPLHDSAPLPETWVLKWRSDTKSKRERIRELMLRPPVAPAVARKLHNTLTFFDSCFVVTNADFK